MTRMWTPACPAADACPLCAAPGPIPPLLEDAGHVLHRCPVCCTCFFADRVVPDYGRDHLANPVYEQLYLEQNGSIHHATRFLFARRGCDSLLDVGCGFGFAVHMASSLLGWRAVGIDPSHLARAGAALLGTDIRDGYLTAETDLGEPFTLVVASEVIEHVPDPAAFLLLLRRWLQPGGTLVLTTPDADAITPAAAEAELVPALSVGAHLFLFSRTSLAAQLRRAGFPHARVEAADGTLVAYASDAPFETVGDDAAHFAGYTRYLRHLVETQKPGTPLWNGAAGRLLAARALGDPPKPLLTLFGQIADAWRERHGFDLTVLNLPDPLPERDFFQVGAGLELMVRATGRAPANLGVVLFHRAVLELRRPRRRPDEVLRWARPALTWCVETGRAMAAGSVMDLDLRQTARRARLMIADMLVELAPEAECDVLVGLATPSGGALSERIDLPPATLAARVAPTFTRLVQTERYDEAARLLPWVQDPDLLVEALAPDPEALFYALFTLGVLRMVHQGRPDEGRALFARLAAEAGARTAAHPRAEPFRQLADEHVAMARTWGRELC